MRGQLLDEFGIEIAGGIGPLKGKIWRVGLMGYVSQAKNVLFFLGAMKKCCWIRDSQRFPGGGVAAAMHTYAQRNRRGGPP